MVGFRALSFAPASAYCPFRGLARSMGITRNFRHQDYELICSASALDSGRFVPGLVVCKQIWPTRPRTIEMRRGDFASEDSALDAAHNQGIEWIRDYG